MKILTSKLIITALFSLLITNTAFAENYALLVGIADYYIKPLSGPINDVNLLKKILNKNWSFKKENIDLILNQAGTKKNILDGIQTLYDNSKSGDNIFIYLSGHGTSARDESFTTSFTTPLPTTSGAFIPIDIENSKTKSDLIENLIIGRKDLKPLLQKFDNHGRHVFVAIDACYSGNTVRGLLSKRKLPARFISLNNLLPEHKNNDNNTLSDIISASNKSVIPYPYKNIFYLSASSDYEPAQEIKANMLARYPTIDGKPHGAFSDTLLRVLNKDFNADINHDGLISYSELKNTVRYFMRIRGFASTPQGLPSLAEDQGKLASRGIFGHQRKISSQKRIPATSTKKKSITKKHSSPALNSKGKYLKIIIDDSLKNIREQVGTIKDIQIVKKNAQLEIRKKDDLVLFISHAGDLILKLLNPDDVDIIENIKQQLWIKQLVDTPFNQDFNIDLDMFASGRGSTVVEGDAVGVAIKTTQAAHILIININAHGLVTVLYPYTNVELQKIDAYKLLAFKELSRVVPPFGREYLQVYAFNKISKDYQDLMAKSFNKQSPDAKILMRLLGNKSLLKARVSLEVVTSELN